MKFAVIVLWLGITVGIAQDSLAFTPQTTPSENQETGSEKVSKNRYIFYSLILPGTGQWKMGQSGRGKFFLGTDFLLWVAFFGSHAYANVIQDDYISYAAIHAGTSSAGKDEQYWIDVGNSDNIYYHNTRALQNRDLAGFYPETAQNYWQWDSGDNRKAYNSMRVEEHDWENRATFVAGALILNRFISAVDVVRMIRKEKRESGKTMSRFYFDYRDTPTERNLVRLNFAVNW